jgi:hypothetical protein
MTISEIGMATIARLRQRGCRRTRTGIVRLLKASTAFAVVAMMMVGGAAFARPVGTTDVPVSAGERTEGEKFADNYGYGSPDRDVLTGRTPQELSTQKALARLHHRQEIAVANQRTEGEKFANNYGFGRINRIAAVERTEGEKFANNYGYGRVDSGFGRVDRLAALERAEGERIASAEATRTTVDSPTALPNPGSSWETTAITASLIVLLAGAAVMILRRRHPSSAV